MPPHRLGGGLDLRERRFLVVGSNLLTFEKGLAQLELLVTNFLLTAGANAADELGTGAKHGVSSYVLVFSMYRSLSYPWFMTIPTTCWK